MLKVLANWGIRRVQIYLALGAIVVFLPLSSAPGQYTVKADAESAIVWSGDQCQKSDNLLVGHEPLCDGVPGIHSDASSLVQDPLTGNFLREISYEGVEVISGLRSDALGCGWNECHTAYTATLEIVDNTEYPLTIDGKTFTSTLPMPTPKEIRKWWGKKANLADFTPHTYTIQPGRSVRIWVVMLGTGASGNVTKWWNHEPSDVIPLRYSIRIRGKDFVYPWLAPIQRNFAAVPLWNY